jgi:hypothetical protein
MGLLVLIVVALIVVLIVMKTILSTSWGRRVLIARPMRSRLKRALEREFVITPIDDVPTELDATTRILESLGFERVAVGRLTSRSLISVLLRPEGDVIARATWGKWTLAGLPRTSVSLISVVSERRGVLVTTDAGFDIDPWPWEIVQIFPHASVDALFERQREGRSLLERRGVRFDQLEANEAVEALAWVQTQTISSALEVPDDILAELPRSVAKEEASLVSRLDDSETIAQVVRFQTATPEG